jgi:hypothetical protein
MSLEIILFCFLAVALSMAVLAFAIRRAIRFQNAIAAAITRIQEREKPLTIVGHYDSKCQIAAPGKRQERWWPCVAAVTNAQLILYERSVDMPERLRFPLDELRWFGRPEKYTTGHNDIWMHFEAADRWQIVRLRLYREPMRDLVRALKLVVLPELVTAYRRQRPYIHIEPTTANPATQDIHGAWTLGEAVKLYVMPRFLVIFEKNQLLRKIPLERLQRIGALRRIDQPGAAGLVRFQAEEETFAFALNNYETFAQQLAEAAKRTLEAPLEQKQKGKNEEDD